MAERLYRLNIARFEREKMPLSVLAEYLSDMAILFGQDQGVHLIAVESHSTCPVILVDAESEPAVLERVMLARDRKGPREAIEALDRTDARLAKQDTQAELLGPTENKVIVFSGASKARPIEWPSINQASELVGIPIAVGGKNDPVPVRLLDGEMEHSSLFASRAKAKEIAQYLFTTELRIFGHGRWKKFSGGAWNLERFVIDDFEPIKISGFDDSLAKLRSIDAAWKKNPDPIATLMNIRGGEPNEIGPNGRV